MINLSDYIKSDFIKESFINSHINVHNIEQIDSVIYSILEGQCRNIIFDNSSLKNYFFTKLKYHYNTIGIINCDSTPSRIQEDIINQDNCSLYVFDHINKCKDLNILNNHKSKSIYIC